MSGSTSDSKVIECFAEVEAVAHAAAIVHGQDDVAVAREVLIHRVGVVVVGLSEGRRGSGRGSRGRRGWLRV